MPLPIVNGWLIDFRTARVIFTGGDNVLINACVQMCENGALKYCHCEDKDFRSDANLKPPFVDDQLCRAEPNADAMQRCAAIAGMPQIKPLLIGDKTTIFLIGVALSFQFGILSNASSPRFATVHDIGPPLGLHVLTAQQFQHLI